MRTRSLLAAGVLALAASSVIADWPRFRGPDGNGIAADKLKLLAKPTEVWTASVGSGNASLIVQEGRLYTVGSQRGMGPFMTCLDAQTGKRIWDVKVDSW